jgi:1-acyl-sn-glycerol-3-phosphate acyltransferase
MFKSTRTHIRNQPQRGNLLSENIGKLMLRASGWKIVGEIPDIPKAVMIAAPHTSNWDAYIAFASTFALRLKVSIMVKHTLFKGPWGGTLKWLGALPVNREESKNITQVCVDRIKAADKMILCITPDGTRTGAEAWKTGFHRIALEAGVPIIMFGFNFERRELMVLGTFIPTADTDGDIKKILQFYKDTKPCRPERLSKPLQDLQRADQQ